ncbi:MAG TPA: SulP family inorganic anion transporter [Gemmatimonadales bacterium]|nr:SulP family inorganic anion transporter [Gemmatimonadales bacterium]
MFTPKLLTTLKTYNRHQFGSDLIAGIIVGVVALPLAIAFAIASGVGPARGLYTAIVAGFLISALGGSRVQIGGPTGAFVVIVAGIVAKYGVDGLLVATFMAGFMLVLFGLFRLGTAIKFIPYPVVVGFTSGIAVVILSSEVRDFFGFRMESVPADFLERWRAFAHAAPTLNPWALGVSLVSLAIMIWWPKVSRRIPGPFVALIVMTVVANLFHFPVETIGSRFGVLHAGLPTPALPHITGAEIKLLIGPAFTIALLGAVESLLSAVVADGMIGGRHRSNVELVAQGVANIASPIFGGIPATGAIARTATNIKNGGRTPVAGMVHALTLLVITMFVGKYAAVIPLAVLAAILVMVAYHMSEWRTFRSVLRAPRSDVLVLLATFLLTVLVDLTVAIQVGMVLAAFLFMKRMAEVTNVSVVTRELAEPSGPSGDVSGAVFRRDVPKGVEVYEINGPFFFGAAESFKNTVGQVASRPKVLIIRMRNVPAMDATGLSAFKDLVRQSRREGIHVFITEIHAQPMVALSRSDLFDELGEENVLGTLDEGLERARVLVTAQPS